MVVATSQQPRVGYKQTAIGVIPKDWEQTRILGIASGARNAIVGGPFGSDLVSLDYVDEGVPVIRGQNMGRQWVSGSFVFVSSTKAKSLEANLARPGDIVFTQRGTLGQVSLVPEVPFDRYLVSQSQMKLSVNRAIADPLFFFYVFTSEKQQRLIQQGTIQTSLPHINLGILRDIPVQLPPLPEQRAIAAALSDVDALIAALDLPLTKKRDIKTATMQQLLTGKKRLPAFSGQWVPTRIGDVLTISHGKNQEAVADPSGMYPILASGGQIGTANRFLYDKPSVLIGRKGTIDQPQYMDLPFWTVDTLFYSVIRPSNNPKFLFYKFCMIDWKQYNEASGVPSLNARTIEGIEIEIPSTDEQIAIAAILTDMDAEIATLEERRDKTQALKQGMMQQLLTGNFRLL